MEHSVIWEGGKITHTHRSAYTHTYIDFLINALWILLEEKWLERTQEAPGNGI